MCGRFTAHLPWPEIVALYKLVGTTERGRNVPPRCNIAPTQDVFFVHLNDAGEQVLDEGRWWLVPHWAKEEPKATLFNARSEEAAEKPSFGDAFKTRRCLIPADGWYEWTKADDGGKDPFYITLPDGGPFSFAGLWAHNKHLGVTSCTILTAAAVEPVSQVHHRMPVVLEPAVYDEWLDPATSVADAKGLLGRHLDGAMVFRKVGRMVNNARYQEADAIEAV